MKEIATLQLESAGVLNEMKRKDGVGGWEGMS